MMYNVIYQQSAKVTVNRYIDGYQKAMKAAKYLRKHLKRYPESVHVERVKDDVIIL